MDEETASAAEPRKLKMRAALFALRLNEVNGSLTTWTVISLNCSVSISMASVFHYRHDLENLTYIIPRHAICHAHMCGERRRAERESGDLEGDVLGGAGLGDAVYDDDL